MLKADFHIHTEYSMDCTLPLEKIINRCLEIGINCIAIADHGTAEGALKMQNLAPFKVIVAEEILTPHGEITGMFLKDTIPSGLSIEQAISEIRAQGGLVSIPHLFDTFRGLRLNSRELEALVDQIDTIEVFNARGPFLRPSIKARAFAQKHDIPGTAGSDAHTAGEIGHAYIEMPEFNGRDDFLQALRTGKVVGHRTNPLIHFVTSWAKLRSLLKRQ
ncbi:PHP-associated domain-containing protein [Chloroflexota bacterium]